MHGTFRKWQALLKLERPSEAEEAATKALKERPNDLKARVRRATALRAQHKYAAAAADFAQVRPRRAAPAAPRPPRRALAASEILGRLPRHMRQAEKQKNTKNSKQKHPKHVAHRKGDPPLHKKSG